MARASLVAEQCGVPSVSIITEGFEGLFQAARAVMGIPLPMAKYPGVPLTDAEEELREKTRSVVAESVVKGLTQEPDKEEVTRPAEPGPDEVVFSGSLDQVQDHFDEMLWSDGLPIIPPTRDRVEQFLAHIDRAGDEVIAYIPAEGRAATLWSVAVNGVMAGCRPEYMPVLVAIVEAVSDPRFNLKNAGSTAGWDPFIIVSGPIVDDLNFNYAAGALRVGRRANTSIGRFLRLYMRNVGGFRIPPAHTDKGAIAGPFNVALAENRAVTLELGWSTWATERGFGEDESIVTVQSAVAASLPAYTVGGSAEEHLEGIAYWIGTGLSRQWAVMGVWFGGYYPLIVMSPSVASVIADDGWSKDDVREYLYEQVRVPASEMEHYALGLGFTGFNLAALVEQGVAPAGYHLTDDRDRLVPVFPNPSDIGIVISGAAERNQSKGFVSSGVEGARVTRRIRM